MRGWLVAMGVLGLLVSGLPTQGASAAPPPGQKGSRASSGPSISSQARQRESRIDGRSTEKSLKASIENQKQILTLEDRSSPSFPKQSIALADFYWDLAEYYGNAAFSEAVEKPLYEAEQKKDEKAIAKWKREQQRYLDLKEQFQKETVTRYREVIRNFPRSESLPEIRYFLAYNLMQMGRGDESVEVYSEIIGKHPDSPFVPDALVNIGDYYFELNDFGNAQKLYQKAQEPQYQSSNIFGYAVYKDAWCLYNMGEYDDSLRRFLDVIELADRRLAEGVTGAIALKREAQNEAVLPYSKVGRPEKAIEFFKKLAPERYLDITSRLATIYTEQSEYGRSIKLLRMLIEEARTNTIGGEKKVWMGILFQRQIVSNAIATNDKATTVAEIGEMIRIWDELGPTAPDDFKTTETDEVKRQILDVAQSYQIEFNKTKDKTTLEYTQRLYDDYLRIFRRDDNAYQISMNNALLMLATDKYEEAAAEFEKVIAMNPDGEFADSAAERSVLAYLKTIQIRNKDLKAEAVDDLTAQELSPEEKRFVTAIDRWMAIVKRRGMNPETKDNVPTARFAAAKVYYNNNHFPEAARRYLEFLDNHDGHLLVNDARRHALSAYNLAHDVDNLRTLATRLDGLGDLPPDLREDIQRVKNAFNFQECFRIQSTKEHLKAAQCFEKYATEFPNSERAASAVYNASINYFEAKRVEKALETQLGLYQKFKNDELAPKALFAIGEMYRQTTVYDEASKWYEFFVKNHPNHPLAEKALRYASIYRKTLGQHREAIRNLDLWLKKYRSEDVAPRVDLDIIQILEKMEDWRRIVTAVDRHIRAFPNEPPGIRLQVLNKKGLALAKMRKTREALAAFNETVAVFGAMEERNVQNLDMPAIAAVAESHFQLGEVELQRARAIKLDSRSDKAIKKALEEKLQILAKVKSTYEKVIAYNHPGWVIAASHQLGLAYEDLADAVENSPDPASIRNLPDVISAYRQEMTDQATQMRQVALFNFRRALDTAREYRWFNEYSEKAERAVARLDLTDLSVKEVRLRPNQLTPNAGVPRFLGGQ